MTHKWITSTLGHGSVICENCKITDAEAAAIGALNKCSKAPETVTIPKASLLTVVRKIDLDASISPQDFACAFDDLRAVFTPDEMATGKTSS